MIHNLEIKMNAELTDAEYELYSVHGLKLNSKSWGLIMKLVVLDDLLLAETKPYQF